MPDPAVPVVEFSPSGKPAEEAPAAAPVVEAKKPDETATPPASDRAKWFATMARREQARVQREQALKAREKAIGERERVATEKEARFAGAKGAPLEALKAAGLTYDDVTNAQLNDGKPSAELIAQQAREEIAALRAELAKKDEAQVTEATTQAQQAKDAARKEFYAEAQAFAERGAETYELLNTFKPYHLVAQAIEAEHQKTGKVLTYAEAAQKVEDALRAEVEKSLSTKWFQSRNQPKPAEQSAKPRATISNDLTPATPGQAPKRPAPRNPLQAAIDRYEENRRGQTH